MPMRSTQARRRPDETNAALLERMVHRAWVSGAKLIVMEEVEGTHGQEWRMTEAKPYGKFEDPPWMEEL